ncbi:molybdopterin-dependent oxidoreductase [Sphingobium sp. V4]|uniref:molybdopterin-containing oxidoreductase family protein n=1 Tax=Sphingobium sp. V4 TaxID=3038927 RepID=UPI002557F109|nr:molybdopterin-dependent oxidoreductase [Sphingobium sp. V4]WIW89527.1 molybdopterin-dependent oxidoreductase [Sphingobium sp. V4]
MPHPLLPGEDGNHPTFCRLCEAFCGLIGQVKDGRVVSVKPDPENPSSQGHMCVKAPAIMDITYSESRVTKPLKRTGKPGEFSPVSWDEALDDIARRLRAIITEGGGDAFASYVGNPAVFSARGWLAAENFTGALGSGKRYSPCSQDTAPRHVASRWVFGSDFLSPIPDLEATDFLIILGSNPLISHGGLLTAPRMRHHLNEISSRGKVVVIDPRRTETARVFEHVPVKAGTDAWLLAAMLRLILEAGLADTDFLAHYVKGWDSLTEALGDFNVERAAAICGIDALKITEMALAFGRTERAAIYSRVGICRTTFGTITNLLIDALNIACGKLGRRGGVMFGFNPLSGGRAPTTGIPRSRIGDLPGAAGFLPCIALPDDILEKGRGRVRALMVTAGNPVLSAPAAPRLVEAVRDLELFFSLDLFVNETNRFAHYILPTTTFIEREDIPMLGFSHMVRAYAQYTPALVRPQGEAREEHEIYRDIAARMGISAPYPSRILRMMGWLGVNVDPMALFDLALRTGPAGDRFGLTKRGLSISALKKHPHGILLDDTAVQENWRKKIAHRDGFIRLWNAEIAQEMERLRNHKYDAGLKLIGRRHLKSLNSWMHRVDKLVRSQTPTLLVHPEDAAERGLSTGDRVRLSSRTGSVEVLVECSDEMIRGTLSYPHGWGHLDDETMVNINLLVPDRPEQIEQVSGASILDAIPVTLERMA